MLVEKIFGDSGVWGMKWYALEKVVEKNEWKMGVLVYEGVLCAVPYTYIGKVSSNCNCLWVFLFPSSLSRCATVRLRGLGVTLVDFPVVTMIGTSRFLQKTARTEPTSILRCSQITDSPTRDEETNLSHASDLPGPCQCHGSLCTQLLEAANLQHRHRRCGSPLAATSYQ